LILMMLVWKKR